MTKIKKQLTICLVQFPGWTPWSAWSSCTKSCGEGDRERQRFCTPEGCQLTPETEREICNAHDCPSPGKIRNTRWHFLDPIS